jgi:hypothetical protein
VLSFGNEAERAAFFEWFDEMFLRPSESEGEGVIRADLSRKDIYPYASGMVMSLSMVRAQQPGRGD